MTMEQWSEFCETVQNGITMKKMKDELYGTFFPAILEGMPVQRMDEEESEEEENNEDFNKT